MHVGGWVGGGGGGGGGGGVGMQKAEISKLIYNIMLMNWVILGPIHLMTGVTSSPSPPVTWQDTITWRSSWYTIQPRPWETQHTTKNYELYQLRVWIGVSNETTYDSVILGRDSPTNIDAHHIELTHRLHTPRWVVWEWWHAASVGGMQSPDQCQGLGDSETFSWWLRWNTCRYLLVNCTRLACHTSDYFQLQFLATCSTCHITTSLLASRLHVCTL